MRKVFSSPRLENVEAVADMLRGEGIDVKIEHGRSYRGHRRGNFSYDTRNAPKQIPAVWIVRAEDQPRGRQLLRDMGLLESTREGWAGHLPGKPPGNAPAAAGFWNRNRHRIRFGLLLLIAAGVALIAFSTRRKTPDVATATPAAAATSREHAATPMLEAISDVQVHRVATPTALARLLVAEALGNRKPAVACLEVDGKDPAPALLQTLQTGGSTRLYPASTCPAHGAFAIAVHDYLTDGSGSGQVQLDLDVEDSQLVDVERHGRTWRVLRRH